MPTLSASDYTTYLKFKAAAASPIQPAIQTRSNATLSQSVINANILASQAAFVAAPTTTKTIAFTATVTTALTTVLSDAVGDGTIITYTSSQPHGLSNGDVVTITGFADFADANVTDEEVTVVDSTSFTVAVAETGTATGTGSITGRVYYTTSAAHGLVVGDIIYISGLSTFGVSGATVLAVPSSTTFILASSTEGDAETDASGVLTWSRLVPAVSVSGLARVRPVQPSTTNNPNALSTVSWTSGTSGAVSSTTSSKFQQTGGLPAKNVVGTYTRLPQNAGWIQGRMLSSGAKRF
jgi:hypothetical protein